MPEALTELERGVLEYLVQYLRVNTYQPSIRDIGRQFSIKSTKTVSELLQSLADKGWIERDPSRSRGVRLLGVDLQADSVTVPVYLNPDAAPVRAVAVDRQIAMSAGTYMVGMPDGALRPLGIQQGDLLMVEPVQEKELASGDVVFALHAGVPIVRQLTQRSEGRYLEGIEVGPAIPVNGVTVRGRVHALIRRLRVPEGVDVMAAARIPVS